MRFGFVQFKERTRISFYIRIAIVVFSAISAAVDPFKFSYLQEKWIFLDEKTVLLTAFFFVAGALSVLFMLAFSLLEHLIDKKKLIFPTWSTDLFTWKFHMQLIHLGGWVFIAMGLAYISVGIIQYGKVHKDGVLMFASGVGFLVGLFLFARIFKERFVTVDSEKASKNIING